MTRRLEQMGKNKTKDENKKSKSFWRHFKPVKRYSGASGSGNTLILIESAWRAREEWKRKYLAMSPEEQRRYKELLAAEKAKADPYSLENLLAPTSEDSAASASNPE